MQTSKPPCLTTYTRRAHRLTKDRPARHTDALKNVKRACEWHILHIVQTGSKAGGGWWAGAAPVAAAMQPPSSGQIYTKMEASACSAISTEVKEPSEA